MSRALLLSPDDQAVTAITGVLEEMAVSCERPLDGVSAAQKLNSHNFDLVLVDCENLPAAKLIFDVCRRGKAGQSPVPIAIVDGRAGLPTAFRLGAELILTKPVSMDHARSTIRTAVGRVKKEESVQMRATPEMSNEAAPEAAQEPVAVAAAAATSAVLAPVAPQLSELFESAPAKTLSVETAPSPALLSNAAVKEAPLPSAIPSAPSESGFAFAPLAKGATEPLFESKPEPEKPADDPVLARIDKADTKEIVSPAPVLSSLKPARPSPAKPANRGGLIAVLVLLIVGGGAYAGWMYVPAFRLLVQPQIDRVMALAVGEPAARPQPKTVLPKQGAPIAASTPVSAAGVPTNQAPAPSTGIAPATSVSTSTPVTTATTSAETPASEINPSPAATTVGDHSPLESKVEKSTRTISLENPPQMDKGVVILSSKGAEKRLLNRVAPVYPKEAKAAKIEGPVVLKVLISNSGKVADVSLVEGDQTLAKVAIHAVKQWRYRPYARDGKDLPFQTIVMVDFQQK